MELWGFEVIEIEHQWMPDWCYVDGEIDDIKSKAVRYGPLGYVMVEIVMLLRPPINQTTSYRTFVGR